MLYSKKRGIFRALVANLPYLCTDFTSKQTIYTINIPVYEKNTIHIH